MVVMAGEGELLASIGSEPGALLNILGAQDGPHSRIIWPQMPIAESKKPWRRGTNNVRYVSTDHLTAVLGMDGEGAQVQWGDRPEGRCSDPAPRTTLHPSHQASPGPFAVQQLMMPGPAYVEARTRTQV